MMTPMTTWQKVIAYSSLVFILLCIAWGSYVIWLLLEYA